METYNDQLDDFFSKNPDVMMKFAQELKDCLYPEEKILDEIIDVGEADLNKALSLCKLGVQLYPNYAYKYLWTISDIFRDLGLKDKLMIHYEDALKYLEESIKVLPIDVENHMQTLSSLLYDKHYIYDSMGRFSEALDCINISHLLGISTTVLIGKCKMLLKLYRQVDALLIINACIINIKPSNASDYSDLIELHSLRKNINEAWGLLKEVEKDQIIISEYSYKEIDLILNRTNIS
ncbi:MAG: hypothetical protein ABUL44_03625 [Flavobacterium sp.]